MRGIYAAGSPRAGPLNETPAHQRHSRPDSKDHGASTRRIQGVSGTEDHDFKGGDPRDAGFAAEGIPGLREGRESGSFLPVGGPLLLKPGGKRPARDPARGNREVAGTT